MDTDQHIVRLAVAGKSDQCIKQQAKVGAYRIYKVLNRYRLTGPHGARRTYRNGASSFDPLVQSAMSAMTTTAMVKAVKKPARRNAFRLTLHTR